MQMLLQRLGLLLRGETARATLYGSLARLGGMILSFLIGLLLARALGASGFGIYGIVISAGGIAASAALLGAPYLAVREVARHSASGDWARTLAVIRRLAWIVTLVSLCAGGVTTAVLILSSTQDPAMSEAALWSLAFVPAYALAVLAASYLRGLDRPVQAQSVEVLVRPLLMLPPLIIAVLAQQALSPAMAIIITAAATALSLAVGLRWLGLALAPHRPIKRDAAPAGLVKLGIPFAAVDVLRQLEGAYPLLILGAVAANAAAGEFRVAQLGAMVIAVPYTVIGHVMSPAMARHGDQPITRSTLLLAARALFGISLACLAAAILIGKPAIEILFGAEYQGAWLPLVILCAAQCVNGFFGVGPILLIMSGQERPMLKIYAITVPIAIAAAIILTTRYGGVGAAAAVLIGTFLSNALAWHHARMTLGINTALLGSPRDRVSKAE